MDCFNDNEEAREMLSDILAKCKYKMANNVCSLNDCSHCANGYVLQFAHKYMSEMELDYIKMMAQIKYESSDYDSEEDEDDEEKELNEKNTDKNKTSSIAALIISILTGVIICLILVCNFASW